MKVSELEGCHLQEYYNLSAKLSQDDCHMYNQSSR